jgi:hypothetical protein
MTRHPVSLLGGAIASVMALLFVVLLLLDAFGYFTNPYFGLLLFVAVPAGFVLGLLLIPVGMRLEVRRRRRTPGVAPADWPIFDLRNRRQRTVISAVVALTVVNLVIVSVAAFGAVHYMETAAFCGQVCHTTMEPQFVAHQSGPHARVPCVDCHVGAGARALVQSKLAGTRQLWQVVTRNVPAPVESPVPTMRAARETCGECHWPEKFHGDKLRVIREYAEDEQNTETVTALTLFVGGGSERLGVGTGIHWHMNLDNDVEYITTDAKREVIPYVRLRDRTGKVREFVTPGTTPEQLARGERRRMDCLDCHNRPAHTFYGTPERAVNDAIAQGRIPKELPWVRREALASVTPDYPDRQAALQAIATRLREYYKSNPGVDSGLVERAIAGTQDLWTRNVFPVMKVKWGTYPNHISHVDTNGCFRCHDDEHKAGDGTVIRQDCELCHKQAE